MDLKNLVINKINELGKKEAAIYFDKTETTINAWLNTGKFPVEAAQKIMDETQQDPPETNRMASVGSSATGNTSDGAVLERLSILELRVSRLEAPPTHTAVVPPKPQPNWTDPHHFGK